jgi:hypothetical protein
MFAVKHSELVNENKGWQIDLLTIIYSDESNLTTISASLEDYQILTIKGKYCLIKHYENIG